MEDRYIPVCKGGGLYHAHKVNYSPETHAMIKKLLDESKLSILQRQALQNSIKNGDPLPGPGNKKDKKGYKLNKNEVLIRPTALKRRSKKAIMESGAYEREQYTPIHNKASYDKEKVRLQSIMAYGKEVSSETANEKRKLKVCSLIQRDGSYQDEKEDLFEHLLLEVEERDEFLKEMEILGEGKKYKDTIEQEILGKIRKMEIIDKERCEKQIGTIAKYRKSITQKMPPKSLPLTALEFPHV